MKDARRGTEGWREGGLEEGRREAPVHRRQAGRGARGRAAVDTDVVIVFVSV